MWTQGGNDSLEGTHPHAQTQGVSGFRNQKFDYYFACNSNFL